MWNTIVTSANRRSISISLQKAKMIPFDYLGEIVTIQSVTGWLDGRDSGSDEITQPQLPIT